MKRYLVFLISMVVTLALVAPFANASEIVVSGKCGDTMTWALDSEGLLTVSGTGDMNASPWPNAKVLRAVIESGGDPVSIDGLVQKYRQQMPRLRDMEELSLWLSEAVRSLISDQLINRNARHSDLIYRTIQYLQNHYASKLTLDEVANSVHISPTYLSRVFKREVGSSMVDFLNRIRIEKSKELLVDESARLIEVALQCGFESQSYFNRMFKQQCGMTPRQYRKLMVNQ